jgi:hypothetical protein
MSFKNRAARLCLRGIQGCLKTVTKETKLNQGLTVFLFHSVTDEPSDYLRATGMWTSNTNFRRQITWIKENFEIVPVTSLLESSDLPKSPAIITFDDAWLGSYEAITRFMIPSGIPLCYFVNFGSVFERVDFNASQLYASQRSNLFSTPSDLLMELFNSDDFSKDSHFNNYQGPLMSHEQLKELSKSSLVTIGNHLYHHFDSKKMSDEFFLSQLILNQKHIDNMGFNQRIFAFPFGASNVNFEERHLLILQKENYELVFSADSRRLSDFKAVPSFIPRIHFSHLDHFESDFWWATFRSQLIK